MGLTCFCLTVQSFNTVVQKAKKHACAAKLLRISESIYAYADDYGDYSIPHRSGKTSGWVRVLSKYNPTLKQDAYHCPDDNVQRNYNAPPISFSLNSGHLWNVRQTNTNIKEWGMASILTGMPVRISRAPIPSKTTWFFEFWNANNNYRQLCNSNDRALFSTYTLYGFHEDGNSNTMLFLDGHIENILKSEWLRGDNRGILFKSLHTPETCTPNLL